MSFKRLILYAALVAPLYLLQVGVSYPHTATYETSMTIHKAPKGTTHAGDRVRITGSLSPDACSADKLIRLFRQVPGPDVLLARDRTDARGNYHFDRRPHRDQAVYTRFLGSVRTFYGHSHTCAKSRSKTRTIDVR